MIGDAFFTRMKSLLDEGYDAFVEALGQDPVRAFRKNPIKGDFDAEAIFPSAEAIPYADGGYIFDAEHIGAHPLHHAGAIYVQDPGAMAPVASVGIRPGDKILDLCAAPGGKATQAAARATDAFLVANEFVPSRAKITVGNIERLGFQNAVVTSLDTAEFPKLYRAYFDLVIADVPCSGEGMFRKSDAAIAEWSEDNVRACAARAKTILENAAPLVKEGGHLLFSTCTYAPEENEEQVTDFLRRHPDYALVPVADAVREATAPGIDLQNAGCDLSNCRRFYPHIARGEGQFMAVLQRVNCSESPTIIYKPTIKPLSKPDVPGARAFLCDLGVTLDESRLCRIGDHLILLPDPVPPPPFGTFLSGVTVAEYRGKNLFPHHQFCSAFGREFARKVDLSPDDPRLTAYLRGEEIPVSEEGGFAAVSVAGIPLGGGKISGGVLKNHYPKGLRNH